MMSEISIQKIPLRELPLTAEHWRIVAVASLGQISGTLLSTIVGVVIPLIQILTNDCLSSFMQGLMGASSLVGIMVGAYVFGSLTDRYGYKFFYRFCPLLVLVAALAGYGWKNEWFFIIILFIMGCGIGGEYSLDSAYISELMPDKWKGFMTGLAKAASAFGNLSAGICWWLLKEWENPDKWNCLLLISAGLALLTLICRLKAFESPAWLVAHGKIEKAMMVVEKLFGAHVTYNTAVKDDGSQAKNEKLGWRNVVLTGVPWACESFAVYGFAVFLPIIVLALGIEHASGLDAYQQVVSSVKMTTLINVFVLIGFGLGLWAIKKLKPIKIQWMGFVLSAAGLCMMILGHQTVGMKWLCLIGFMTFEMFLNAGPHLVTFVLPSEIYPASDRATGSGVAAAMGKVGSVSGVFAIPILLKMSGLDLVLWVSVGILLTGALVTVVFGKFVKKGL